MHKDRVELSNLLVYFLQWRNTALLEKIDRKIKKHVKQVKKGKTKMYVDEINLNANKKR